MFKNVSTTATTEIKFRDGLLSSKDGINCDCDLVKKPHEKVLNIIAYQFAHPSIKLFIQLFIHATVHPLLKMALLRFVFFFQLIHGLLEYEPVFVVTNTSISLFHGAILFELNDANHFSHHEAASCHSFQQLLFTLRRRRQGGQRNDRFVIVAMT